jgi:osmotically-inducible protein OsmY
MRQLLVGLAIVSLTVIPLSSARADDQGIGREVAERLKQLQTEGELREFDIHLTVADGTVLLKGHVASEEGQKLALEAAQGTKGVKRVIDALQLPPVRSAFDASESRTTLSVAPDTIPPSAPAPAGPDRSAHPTRTATAREKTAGLDNIQIGEAITAELKRRQRAGALTGFGVSISVDQGVVVLGGQMSSSEQMRLALHIARSTPGVRKVVSYIVVTGAPLEGKHVRDRQGTQIVSAAAKPVSDDELVERIAAAIRQQKASAKLKGFDLKLSAEDGAIVCAGQVASAEQLQLVVDLARKTPGVREVVNKLAIAERPSSAEITKAGTVKAIPANYVRNRDEGVAGKKTVKSPAMRNASWHCPHVGEHCAATVPSLDGRSRQDQCRQRTSRESQGDRCGE